MTTTLTVVNEGIKGWPVLLLPLVGTIVGGAITIMGQFLLFRRQAAQAEAATIRQFERADRAEQRQMLQELMIRAGNDVADLRRDFMPAHEDAVNVELAEAAAASRIELTARWNAAAALMARLDNRDLAEQADGVYRQWELYLHNTESQAIGATPSDNEDRAERARTSLGEFLESASAELRTKAPDSVTS